MGRRSGFTSILNALAREAARQQREAERQQRLQFRESARQTRLQAIAQKNSAKEAKQRHLEQRLAEVEEKNTDTTTLLKELSGILEQTFSFNDLISFESLRLSPEFHLFSPPSELTKAIQAPQEANYLAEVKPPSWLARLIPGAQSRYERALKNAKDAFMTAYKTYEQKEATRLSKLSNLKNEYAQSKEAYLLKVQQRNEEVDALEDAYRKGEPNEVITYNAMVLERSIYPDGFPDKFRLAYVPESKELVMECELPGTSVVPVVSEYRYVKSKNAIEEKPRKPAEVKEIYQDVVAAVSLRTIHEVFEADQCNHLQVVAFNGFVSWVDPATGKDTRPCLVSVRVTRERFMDLDLKRIDKRACLRNLGAQVSQSPSEMVPVKPIVEFDMVDKRFVEQGNVLSDLESRPNLMDLNPFEFETLVANLFHQMGIESKLTRSSRDGGVDVVGFDKRPILGGKVVIQAKRYKNTVGVSAVRDLYGTMMNEGANKGILVTTSGYGPDAFEFAKDKPIELIEGGGLLYLLEQIGVAARIVMPVENGV